MSTVPHFPERLRFQRLRLKLSQEKLGERVGVSQNAISTWERGESTPQIPELLTLCSLFNVSPLYLAGVSDSESGLAPDEWIIDVDRVERPVEGEDWCWQVPRRLRIVSYQEMRRIEDEVNAARRAAKKRKGRADDSS